MNINALLSDSTSRESSASGSPSPHKQLSARPAGGKRTASGLSQEITGRSANEHTSYSTSRPPSDYPTNGDTRSPPAVQAPSLQGTIRHQSQGTTPPNFPPPPEDAPRSGPCEYVQAERLPLGQRPSTTPHWETVSTRQHQHQQAPSTGSLREAPAESQRSPTLINPTTTPHAPRIFRNTSGQSLADLTMAEASAQTPPPRIFTATSLSESELQSVTELVSYVKEYGWAYESHVQLLTLLRRGLMSHMYPPTDDETRNDPRSYGLLAELGQEREAMDSRFALGEELALERIQDEAMLARSSEDRIAVTELCQKAVEDEPASTKLRLAYADWVQSNYVASHNLDGADQTNWTEEDKEVFKELFTQQMLFDVLEQASVATQWRFDDGHLIWNRYIEMVLQDFPSQPTNTELERLHAIFMKRLKTPHLAWDETAQLFWPIVSKYGGEGWEDVMQQITRETQPAKVQRGIREEFENKLRVAGQSGDKIAIYDEFSTYLAWEKRYLKRSPLNLDLYCALYERALLYFPTNVKWWLDYTDLVTTHGKQSTPLLPLIERAIRHCPWSGDLWAKRIIRCGIEKKPYSDVDYVKHKGTSSGVLEVGGMEELIKVLVEWCNYLRRHAFTPDATEDELATAEVGVVMASEEVQQAGIKLYGEDFQGDPLGRIEKIQVKFFTQARRFEDARNVFKKQKEQHKNSHDFWARWYTWEAWLWAWHRMSESHRVETPENGPHLATGVIQEGFSQGNRLDWPERMIEMYVDHFRQHESDEKLEIALVEAREATARVQLKRAKEAEAAAEAAAQQEHAMVDQHMADVPAVGEKRKRDGEAVDDGDGFKRSRTEDAAAIAQVEAPSPIVNQMKRDREHNTVTARNLPGNTTEVDVKKFFSDCGTVKSVSLLHDEASNTASATVEFGDKESADFAKSRDGRELGSSQIRVQSGTRSTLYVTNYPPDYDEKKIRGLFEPHGEISNVRFPSLKFNSRRRFCYVQFLSPDITLAAEKAMDGTPLDNLHKLVARISDPLAAKQRVNAMTEGLEVFVKNIDRHVPEDEVRTLFSQYGEIGRLSLVKLVNGMRTGAAFVTYKTAAQANAALEAHGTIFRNRELKVEMAREKGGRAPLAKAHHNTVIVKRSSASPAPDAADAPATAANGRRASTASAASTPALTTDDSERARTARARKAALFNLPDTINEARIQAAMGAYGPLVKIQTRREISGAVLEFERVNDAFNVRQGVDCSALGGGVRSGDVYMLLHGGREGREGMRGGVGTGPGGTGAKAARLMKPSVISRPVQRGGRRGGLGYKRGGGVGGGGGAERKEDGGEGSGEGGTKGDGEGARKGNAAFRDMFMKSKDEAEKKDYAETREADAAA